jgi:hypothetical protein
VFSFLVQTFWVTFLPLYDVKQSILEAVLYSCSWWPGYSNIPYACTYTCTYAHTHAETIAKLAASFDLIRESPCAQVLNKGRKIEKMMPRVIAHEHELKHKNTIASGALLSTGTLNGHTCGITQFFHTRFETINMSVSKSSCQTPLGVHTRDPLGVYTHTS